MKVRLHPEARAELLDARSWYYERSPLSATAFAHAVDNAITRVREALNSFPPADHGTRKFILQRFPLNIFYRPDEGTDRDRCRGLSEAKTRLLVWSSHFHARNSLKTESQ